MYAVQALIGPYFKRFISYAEAERHAIEMANKEGQPFQVVELKLMFNAKAGKG